MAFVQIIEYQTSKPDEIASMGEEFQGRGPRRRGSRPTVW